MMVPYTVAYCPSLCPVPTVVKRNDWTDRLTLKKPSQLSAVVSPGRSELLRSLRHYLRAKSQGHHHTIDPREETGRDSTGGHKAKDITPSIARRREACRKKEALNDFLRQDERGLSSIRPTLEPFQRQSRENFRDVMAGLIYGFS